MKSSHKEKQQMEEFREKQELDAELLEAYVQDVREYNEQLAREKYEMELLEQRRQRKERREKIKRAKLDASAAMQKGERSKRLSKNILIGVFDIDKQVHYYCYPSPSVTLRRHSIST